MSAVSLSLSVFSCLRRGTPRPVAASAKKPHFVVPYPSLSLDGEGASHGYGFDDGLESSTWPSMIMVWWTESSVSDSCPCLWGCSSVLCTWSRLLCMVQVTPLTSLLVCDNQWAPRGGGCVLFFPLEVFD